MAKCSHPTGLHAWQIIKQNNTHSKEYCKYCKQTQVFKTKDNNTYYETHKRDFIQPTGKNKKLFDHIYK